MESPSAAADGATANRYEILARLATGGMAELYLARATAPDDAVSHVVLKRILPSRSTDPQFVTMFLDEARLASQLQHPNIAQVFDIGRLGSSYFFTMEYVHGENVRAVLQREYGLRRQVPIGHAITIAAGAATGLHHAHEALGPDRQPLGIVHRDVSPPNIMASFDGAVKLVDFGVAKAAVRLHQTRAGTVKGKIAYLSPEQCTGKSPVDRRSDVFSLGIVLYELLTVARLFRRDTDFATMAAIVSDEMPPPSRLRPDVPAALDAVVMTALAKQPEARFPTAGAMVDALERAATTSGIELSVAGLGRYLRELFGVRPEPWIELESLEQHPAPVTVTGESMIQIPVASPIGPAASMWPGGHPPQAPIGEVAEIEAALIRTVQLQAVPQPDDDDFLGGRPDPGPAVAPAPAGKSRDRAQEELEDRPTMIDELAPEMPSDLEETTPIEAIDPVTPRRPVTALPRAGSVAPPPPVPPHARIPPNPLSHTPPPLMTPPPPTLPYVAQPLPLAARDDDHEQPWTRDTYVETPAGGTEATAISAGPPEPPAGPPVAAPHGGQQPVFGPLVGPPAVAGPFVAGSLVGAPPRLKLRTKLVAAGIGVIIAALIIRAATHHAPKVDPPATAPGPGLPPP